MIGTFEKAGLSVRNLSKGFGDLQALSDVTLNVKPGEVLSVTGPSGAGKTTLCKCIAGLVSSDAGMLHLGGQDLAYLAAGERRVAFLFESYALYPHKSVFENAASPLEAPGQQPKLSTDEIAARVRKELELLAIDHLEHRLPSELSGGQKQRAALARALVQRDAGLTILDEPISHLDAKLRHRLRGEIKREMAGRASPAIWVTRDGLEALSVGDRVAILINGRIAQIATPQNVWAAPANTQVARLIGDPPMNLLDATLLKEGETAFGVLNGGVRISLPPECYARLDAATRGTNLVEGGAVILGIKPRDVELRRLKSVEEISFEVASVEPFGKHDLVSLLIGDTAFKVKTRDDHGLRVGHRAGLRIVGDVTFFERASGDRIKTLELSSGSTEGRAVPAL